MQSSYYGSVSYTLASVTSLQSGFDGATFGSPVTRDWARGDLGVRHSFIVQAGKSFKYGGISLFGRFASGRPYTPMVAADVNGDGLANDRAFVFDPARATDPALAAGLRSLLTTGTPETRWCLTSQLGRAAERNSCEGPWTADLNASVKLNTHPMGDPWRKFNVTVNIANPLGGLDQLLHGANLRGWGNPAFPNPTLLQVRGFDPAASRFFYTVNPRFGDTRPSNTAVRAPFRVTLDVSMSYGPTTAVQQLDRWLRPGRDGRPGTKLTAADLKRRYSRNVGDPYRGILSLSDSLLLTPEQVKALQTAQAAYNTRVDSVWTALTSALAALPDRFDAAAALSRQEETIDQVWDMGRPEMQAVLPKILNQLQLKLLPWPAQMLYTATKPIKGIRTFYFGDP